MFCKNCGKQIDDDSKFCSECGAIVANNPDPSVETGFPVPVETLEKAYGIYGKNKVGFSSYLVSECGLNYKEANAARDQFLLAKTNEPSPSFFKRLANQVEQGVSDVQNEKAATDQRIKENKQNGVACCPKCGSTSLSANKKGFGIGKAVVGAALTGGIGLVAGNIGAKKVWVTCLNCGHRWKM
jgi:RNA polymerase subunit RPABC4/transcription elongation factor Spt4